MPETPDSAARRISFHPPRDYSSGKFKTVNTARPDTEIVDFSRWVDLYKLLDQVHPWPILPKVVKEMIRGPILLFAQKNSRPTKSELSKLIWHEAAPLLEELGMLVQVVEKSESPGRFRVLSISLVAAETRDKITDIIAPEQDEQNYSSLAEAEEEDIPTSPGTPSAKKVSSNPPSTVT